ncbi:uncharacterized protein LOC135366295 [Ornithodoros turicata]|uniref:uncharacterized protein LOC135366295 n=1 Tax=Ornithodoros turicata TaxID=34597 RepID=UPI0031393211
MTGAIAFASPDRVPKGAVLLTRQQALEHHWELISKWKPTSEMFPLRAGSGISASAVGISSMIIHSMFRKHYRLQSFARASTYLPSVALPMIGAFLSQHLVASDIILLNTRCTACLQSKGIAQQLFFGLLYPVVTGPALCITFALRYNTYALPPLKTHYGSIIQDALMTVKRSATIVTIFGLQAAVAFLLLHMQMRSVLKLHSRHYLGE